MKYFYFGLYIIGFLAIIPITFFFFYAFFGFMDWIFQDPFDWISDPVPFIQQEIKDVIRCRENGGYPITSSWDSRLLKCDIKANQNL